MDSFLTDMLVTAKMAEGKLILSRSMVDVNQLVQEVAKIHGYLAESKGRKLVVVDVPKETRQVSLDANLFYRTLDNLISNALKLSPPEGTVTLRAEYPASPMPLVRIQVVDEGPGIPEEDRDRIFDKFEVASLMQQGIPQLGLGLVFCKMVVDAHGGRIFVESNEPHGSIFTVEM
jgi:signal transduction histidine kinase